ncbi:DMT family transporter [Nonomuraea sp. NPDC050153]|uniref:DMT family transporter n=1 Tax=Nonomuraea sp. NPDC050153 TaxID=3364359 RepID=UPI0037A78129
MIVITVSLGAACLLGVGFVAQQHAAYREPLEEMLHARLLLNLMRMPLWLTGLGLMVCGQILGAIALRGANVSLAALPVVVVAAALVCYGLRRSLKIKAIMLAAAGVLYGLQDVLTRGSLLTLDSGLSVLATWQLYALPSVAVVGLLLNQSAFDAAPLQISLPATTVAEPICGIVLGVAIFAERLLVTPAALAGEVAGLVAMVAGIVILGRSPYLAKPAQPALQGRRGEER